MSDGKKLGQVLIVEGDRGIRDAFSLMLGGHYELVFTEDAEDLHPLLRSPSVRLLIWDLHCLEGTLQRAFQAVQENTDFGPGLDAASREHVLEVLQKVRHLRPDLKVVLVSDKFAYDFQASVIQRFGLLRFVTKPWSSSHALSEQIQVILGDKKSSIQRQVLRMPLVEKTGGRT